MQRGLLSASCKRASLTSQLGQHDKASSSSRIERVAISLKVQLSDAPCCLKKLLVRYSPSSSLSESAILDPQDTGGKPSMCKILKVHAFASSLHNNTRTLLTKVHTCPSQQPIPIRFASRVAIMIPLLIRSSSSVDDKQATEWCLSPG
jgi:hypothetical protein